MRSVILYDTKCWDIKKQHVHKMSVIEMRMLRWIMKNTNKDKLRNEEVCL